MLLALGIRKRYAIGSDVVDPLEIIRAEGIRLHMAPSGETRDALDGMYVREAGASFIYINTAKMPRRQRATAAHELGHHVLRLDDDENVEFVDWNAERDTAQEEREAFNFARELLVDRDWVNEHCPGHAETDQIELVVNRFDVSPELAAVQLAQLELIPDQAKIRFLAAQKDEGTRQRVGKAKRPDRSFAPDPTFMRRIRLLRERDILSPEREAELLDHAKLPVAG